MLMLEPDRLVLAPPSLAVVSELVLPRCTFPTRVIIVDVLVSVVTVTSSTRQFTRSSARVRSYLRHISSLTLAFRIRTSAVQKFTEKLIKIAADQFVFSTLYTGVFFISIGELLQTGGCAATAPSRRPPRDPICLASPNRPARSDIPVHACISFTACCCCPSSASDAGMMSGAVDKWIADSRRHSMEDAAALIRGKVGGRSQSC